MFVGMSKKDMDRRKHILKVKLEELQKKVDMDPLKRDRRLHEEYEEVRKKIAEFE